MLSPARRRTRSMCDGHTSLVKKTACCIRQGLVCPDLATFSYRNTPMRINLNQFYVFYLAARHNSMAAAARNLYVSPSAVTMQVKKMESLLGFSVFDRSQGELRLTEKGEELFNVLDTIFGNVDELEQCIRDLTRAEEGEVKLGTHHLPGNYFISDLIAQAQEKYPDLKVKIELGTQDALLEKLYLQQLDFVLIIGEMPPESKCRVIHLFDEEIALVTSSKGDLGAITSLSVRELGGIPLILQQKGTGALREVLHFLERHEVQPDILLENLSSDVIKQFLHTMRAGSFIGRFIVQKELDEGSFHEIKIREGTPVYRFQLVYLDNQYLPLRVKHFIAGIAGFTPKFHILKSTN